jgi:hypothetical protein
LILLKNIGINGSALDGRHPHQRGTAKILSSSYDRTLSAPADTLQALEIPITKQIFDGLSTRMKTIGPLRPVVAARGAMTKSDITRGSGPVGVVG